MDTHAAELLGKAAQAAAAAYSPHSGYRVGAALRTDDGAVFTGCNVENASFGLTVCAERVAVFNAVAAGRRRFTALAVVAGGATTPYPCGACRQVLAEFCDADFPVFLARCGELDAPEQHVLGTLLPHAFKLK